MKFYDFCANFRPKNSHKISLVSDAVSLFCIKTPERLLIKASLWLTVDCPVLLRLKLSMDILWKLQTLERFRESGTGKFSDVRTSRLYRSLSLIFARVPSLPSPGSGSQCALAVPSSGSGKLFNGKLKRDLQMEHESSDFDLANIL